MQGYFTSNGRENTPRDVYNVACGEGPRRGQTISDHKGALHPVKTERIPPERGCFPAYRIAAGERLDVFMIDLPIPLPGMEHQITAWLLRDGGTGWTGLVDPGPTSTVPGLVRTLRSIDVRSVDTILATHVHLDHSGGTAAFLKDFPGCGVYAPPRGRPHLTQPEKLYEASVATLGATVIDAFGRPGIVAPHAFLDASPVRELEILPTPGHASHHDAFVYHSSAGLLLFPGEAAGVALTRTVADLWIPRETLARFPNGELPADFRYQYPGTPPRFEYDIYRKSAGLLRKREYALMCYSHYGWTEEPAGDLDRLPDQMEQWKTIAAEESRAASSCGMKDREVVERIALRLRDEDPLIAAVSLFDAGNRVKEEFFLRNSILGFLGYVRSTGGSGGDR